MHIREHSLFRLGWDAIVLVLALMSSVIVAYQLAFFHEISVAYQQFAVCVGAVFLLDIVFNFHTTYRQAGAEVSDRPTIRRHYLRSHLFVDLLANVPSFILLLLTIGNEVGGSVFVKAIHLLVLLRLVRIFVIVHRWEDLVWTHPGYLRVFKYLSVILVITHCVACLWFAQAFYDQYPADSWVVRAGIENSDPLTQYLRSLYWTITTMTTVGYGDITPARPAEYLLAILVMLMGASLYAFIIGGIASLLSNLQAAKNSYWARMESLEEYLRARRVPAYLGAQVHNYFEYLWERHKGGNEENLLSHLPESLRLDIMRYLAGDLLERVPLFLHCSEVLQNQLLMALRPVTFGPGNLLVREGEIGRAIFFITSGKAEIIGSESDHVFGTLQAGDYFGHLTLTLNEPRSGSVRAVGFCEVLILDKADYERINTDYPEFREVIRNVAAQRGEQASELLLNGILL